MENKTWNQVLDVISGKITRPSYNTWFSKLECELQGNAADIWAPNTFTRDWIRDRYHELIQDVLFTVTDHKYEITYNTKTNEEAVTSDNQIAQLLSIQSDLKSLLATQNRTNELLSELLVLVRGKKNKWE